MFVSASILEVSKFYKNAAKGYKMNNEQMVCLAVTSTVIIYAFPSVDINILHCWRLLYILWYSSIL